MREKIWLGIVLPLAGLIVAVPLMAQGTAAVYKVTASKVYQSTLEEPEATTDSLDSSIADEDSREESEDSGSFPEPAALAILGAGVLSLSRRER